MTDSPLLTDARPPLPGPPVPGPARPAAPPRTALGRYAEAWRIGMRITALNFRAQLEYRGEFLLQVCVGIVWQMSIIVFATVLLSQFSGMGGWSSPDILLGVAVRMLSNGLSVLICGNVGQVVNLAQAGRIDGFLLRPMPVYRQVLLSRFPVNALGDVTVGIALFVGALERSTLDWTPGRSAYLVATVIGATLVTCAIFTVVSAAGLHYPSTTYWDSWVDELTSTFGSYPLSIMPRLASGALTFVLPLAFIAYLPIGVLTGHSSSLGVPVALAAAAPAVGLAAFVAARLLWNASLRRYKGVNG